MRGGNFQMSEETKNQVTAFFNQTSDISEIKAYCDQNRGNCIYYCRNINKDHEICKDLMNYTFQGRRQQ